MSGAGKPVVSWGEENPGEIFLGEGNDAKGPGRPSPWLGVAGHIEDPDVVGADPFDHPGDRDRVADVDIDRGFAEVPHGGGGAFFPEACPVRGDAEGTFDGADILAGSFPVAARKFDHGVQFGKFWPGPVQGLESGRQVPAGGGCRKVLLSGRRPGRRRSGRRR